MVPAGRLNTFGELQKITREQDDMLRLKRLWGKVADAWFAVEQPSGSEAAPEQQVVATSVWMLTTRWSAELAAADTNMRIKIAGRVLGIKRINNDKLANRELVFECEEAA